MAEDCCQLVGNFPITDRCIISISLNSSTESSLTGENLIVGPTIGTVSLTGYATNEIHIGCPGRASVSIPWIRRYDCDNDIVHFIFAGPGSASISGDVNNLARLYKSLGRTYDTFSASVSSGPATLYMKDTQEDGYGLIYTGGPYPISVTYDEVEPFSSIIDVGASEWYLQSFSLECSPGNIPTVSYSFVFQIKD